MGKHVDKLLKATANEVIGKEVKVESTKAFKELVKRVEALEKALAKKEEAGKKAGQEAKADVKKEETPAE